MAEAEAPATLPPLEGLDEGVLVHVLSCLAPFELERKTAVCAQRLRAISRSDLIWRPLCAMRWARRRHEAAWLRALDEGAHAAEDVDVAAITSALGQEDAPPPPPPAAAVPPLPPAGAEGVARRHYVARERQISCDLPIFAMSSRVRLH